MSDTNWYWLFSSCLEPQVGMLTTANFAWFGAVAIVVVVLVVFLVWQIRVNKKLHRRIKSIKAFEGQQLQLDRDNQEGIQENQKLKWPVELWNERQFVMLNDLFLFLFLFLIIDRVFFICGILFGLQCTRNVFWKAVKLQSKAKNRIYVCWNPQKEKKP